jgi:hypothetical protein
MKCSRMLIAFVIVVSATIGGVLPHAALLWHVTRPPVDFVSTSWVDGTEVCAGQSIPIEVRFQVNHVGPVQLVTDWHRSPDLGSDSVAGTARTVIVNAKAGTVTDPDIVMRVPDTLPPGTYTRISSVISLSGYSRASIREEVVTVVECP